MSREAEAKGVATSLGRPAKGIEFKVYGLFPDLSDLNLFDGLAERVLDVLRKLRKRGRLVIAVFISSRIEVLLLF